MKTLIKDYPLIYSDEDTDEGTDKKNKIIIISVLSVSSSVLYQWRKKK
jgi:hypothetical protein